MENVLNLISFLIKFPTFSTELDKNGELDVTYVRCWAACWLGR